MNNDTTIGRAVQYQIERFAFRISKRLSKPKKKFISQTLFGIQASRDVKLSNVSRSLNEKVHLLQTEKRLSRHFASSDLTEDINTSLIEDASSKIASDTVLAMDLSDINKPFAKKMEYLSNVWDGSEGKVASGYWICEVTAAAVKGDEITPLYSELYSHEAAGFESENDQILKAVRTVSAHTNKRGIWTMDRGADRKILVGELGKLKLRFVIRAKGNRNMKDEHGNVKSTPDILKTMRYKEHYSVTIDKEGFTETISLDLAIKHKLFIEDVEVSLVVIRGFGKEPMILITNVDKAPHEILDIYLTRWKCEESFRFLKHEYHVEDVRVRRYTGLRNTIALIHAVFYFVSVYLGRRMRLRILLDKIIERAKRFFQVPAFKHYAVADGIYRLLFNKRWREEDIENEPPDKQQLRFSFV
jgi:hypothetical protein